MKKQVYKNITEQLANSEQGNLQRIIRKYQQLDRLNQVLQQVLEARFKPHCKVGNFRDGILVLVVDSPTWVTPLRFQVPEILQSLRKTPALAGIAQIELKVVLPTQQPKLSTPRQLSQLSSETAQYYESLAEHCDHADLSDALRMIARHQAKSD